MADPAESSSPVPIRQQLEETSAAYARIASTLSEAITRFELWLNTLKGKTQVTVWTQDPSEEIKKIGLWVRRRDKVWDVACRVEYRNVESVRRSSAEIAGRRAGLARLSLPKIDVEAMLYGPPIPGSELWEAWDPLSEASVAVKVAAVPLLPKLVEEMLAVQTRQVAKIETAVGELDALIGNFDALKEGK